VLANSRQRKDRLVEALVRAGIGASGFYPSALADVPEVSIRMASTGFKYDGAREIANSIVTLPTHSLCPSDLPARVRHAMLSAATG
jgi:hypothetical protein